MLNLGCLHCCRATAAWGCLPSSAWAPSRGISLYWAAPTWSRVGWPQKLAAKSTRQVTQAVVACAQGGLEMYLTLWIFSAVWYSSKEFSTTQPASSISYNKVSFIETSCLLKSNNHSQSNSNKQNKLFVWCWWWSLSKDWGYFCWPFWHQGIVDTLSLIK